MVLDFVLLGTSVSSVWRLVLLVLEVCCSEEDGLVLSDCSASL